MALLAQILVLMALSMVDHLVAKKLKLLFVKMYQKFQNKIFKVLPDLELVTLYFHSFVMQVI